MEHRSPSPVSPLPSASPHRFDTSKFDAWQQAERALQAAEAGLYELVRWRRGASAVEAQMRLVQEHRNAAAELLRSARADARRVSRQLPWRNIEATRLMPLAVSETQAALLRTVEALSPAAADIVQLGGDSRELVLLCRRGLLSCEEGFRETLYAITPLGRDVCAVMRAPRPPGR
jgi:hypothetical protein